MFRFQLPTFFTRAAQCVALPLLLAAPTIACADLLLISRVTDDDGPATAAYLWVGESALRFDNGKQALIADFAQQRIHLLDHAARTYTSADIGKAATAAPIVERQAGTTAVRRWTASEYLIRWPEYRLTTRVYTSQIEGIDANAFSKTLRQLTGVPGTPWLAAMATLPGIPVRIETTRRNADGSESRQVRDTVNVMQRTPPVATYRIPSGYTARD